MSLGTFNLKDPTFNQSVNDIYEIQNTLGAFGSYLAGVLIDFFGLAAWVWVLFFIVIAISIAWKGLVLPLSRCTGYFILFICLLFASEFFHLTVSNISGGGLFGSWLFLQIHSVCKSFGSFLILVFFTILGLELAFRIPWFLLSLKGMKILLGKAHETQKANTPTLSEVKRKLMVKGKTTLAQVGGKKNKGDELKINIRENSSSKTVPLKYTYNTSSTSNTSKDTPQNTPQKRGFFSRRKESDKTRSANLPSIDLLNPTETRVDAPTREALEAKAKLLIQCIEDFGVQGTLAEISPGPVVTMFEIRPERGVKAKRFEVLNKDIAMAIKAENVRIQAPIPGTDTVGIEIPNDKREMVSFRETIQSESFINSKSLLTLGLGKDIFGTPVSATLESMPHLLVAGATGSGKSVCLNSIILSILYKASPDQVRMLLIDPKRVELAMYEGLPHLVHPVVTDMDLAKNALLWVIDEMDQRYTLFKNNHVRNFTEYNAKVKDKADEAEQNSNDTEENLAPLPYILVIVDELADLMMTKGKEVETCIVRLAQLARAAGIHLVIATQRPSVDVVTGLIKANFPSRIAFQVTSGVDSRTILDSTGAENLLGMGDMLFKPRSGALRRMHGAFVSDKEVTAVVNHWKSVASPNFNVDFSQYGSQADTTLRPDGSDFSDPMYDSILSRVLEMDEVSISMLQRYFKLGFGRAGRIVDQLEKEGIVGPPSGSKPRKVLR